MSSGADAAFAGDSISPAILVELEFGSGMVRLWSPGIGDIEWNDVVWTGCGALGKIGDIEETAESRATGVELELTGIPLTTAIDGVDIDILAIANSEDWQQRPVRIYYGLLSATRTWAVEPFQIRKGLMDLMELDEGKTATVRLKLESMHFDLERAEVLRYTAEAQRALHPGDAGCDQIAALQEKEIRWNLS